jgi:hypothetical protein
MTTRIPGPRASMLVAALLASCTAAQVPDAEAHLARGPQQEARQSPPVVHWGSMRSVLRDGRTEGRVELAEVLGRESVAVGALAGLAGEITVVAGTAHLAEVVDAESAQGLRTWETTDGEQATLLIAAEVASWSEHRLPAVSDLAALGAEVRAVAEAAGIDVSEPFPFRVEGIANAARLHVMNHSCPIAHPDGPQPWRWTGESEPVRLVGFYAEGSGGVLTHHGEPTHTHAVLPARNVSGHLDDVSLRSGARLLLPGR